jgi:hypothetical protein
MWGQHGWAWQDGTKEGSLPATLAGAVLLGLLGVGVGVAGLGEVTGEVFRGEGGAIGEAGVVTVVELVRFAHWQED